MLGHATQDDKTEMQDVKDSICYPNGVCYIRDYAGWRGLAAFATEVSKLLHWSPSSQLASVSGI